MRMLCKQQAGAQGRRPHTPARPPAESPLASLPEVPSNM